MAIDTRKARRNYVALTLSLATGTAQNILALINTALGSQAECSEACRELNIQNAAGNTGSVYIGDNLVTAANNGYELVAGSAGAVGASRTYRANLQNVLLGELYVFSTAASQKINVEVCVY